MGRCEDGKAYGYGMLRNRSNGDAGPVFYGEIRAGIPNRGIVDDNGGYRVGRFDGHDLDTDEQSVTIDSFDAATLAARAVADIYAAQGNKASAEYYRKVADTLFNQVE